jgi:hypothetical protein
VKAGVNLRIGHCFSTVIKGSTVHVIVDV